MRRLLLGRGRGLKIRLTPPSLTTLSLRLWYTNCARPLQPAPEPSQEGSRPYPIPGFSRGGIPLSVVKRALAVQALDHLVFQRGGDLASECALGFVLVDD